MDAYSRTLDEVFRRASAKTKKVMTADLRAYALKRGWPSEAVRTLYVHFDGDGFHPRYSDRAKDLVEELEYGDHKPDGKEPNPVLRTWANRSHLHPFMDHALADSGFIGMVV